MEGSARVGMDGQNFEMTEGDIVLINSNSIHELYSTDGAVLVALQIKPDSFKINNTFSNSSFTLPPWSRWRFVLRRFRLLMAKTGAAGIRRYQNGDTSFNGR